MKGHIKFSYLYSFSMVVIAFSQDRNLELELKGFFLVFWSLSLSHRELSINHPVNFRGL